MPENGHSGNPGQFGVLRAGGARGLARPEVLLYAAEAFVVRRSDSLGSTLPRRRAFLESELPSDAPLYFGLFSRMPDRAGAGGEEIAVAGYARVEVTSWVSATRGAVAIRYNGATIAWDPLGVQVEIVGWGIWDTAEESTGLRVMGLTRANGGTPRHYIASSLTRIAFPGGGVVLEF